MVSSSASQVDINRAKQYRNIERYITKPLSDVQIQNIAQLAF